MLCNQEKGPHSNTSRRWARTGPLLTSGLALWDTDGIAARPVRVQTLGNQEDHQADLGPAGQQQNPQKSSRWHLGPSGDVGCTPVPCRPAHLQVCMCGCEQGAVHGAWTCVPVEVSQDRCTQVTFVHAATGMLAVCIYALIYLSHVDPCTHDTHLEICLCFAYACVHLGIRQHCWVCAHNLP